MMKLHTILVTAAGLMLGIIAKLLDIYTVNPEICFCVWHAQGKGLLSKIIALCVIIVLLTAAVVMFDKIRVPDIVPAFFTGIVLLKSRNKKINESEAFG